MLNAPTAADQKGGVYSSVQYGAGHKVAVSARMAEAEMLSGFVQPSVQIAKQFLLLSEIDSIVDGIGSLIHDNIGLPMRLMKILRTALNTFGDLFTIYHIARCLIIDKTFKLT